MSEYRGGGGDAALPAQKATMLLQVVTRTCAINGINRRPTMLARNQASLARLSDHDWQQTLVVDDKGRGVTWANMNLATVEAVGEYVWLLDDDDQCATRDLLGVLKKVTDELKRPGVVMMRVEHAAFGVLPHDENWQKAPVLGDCGFSNFFIRGDVWEEHRAIFRELECYEADYHFAAHLWRAKVSWVWADMIAAIYPQRSIGAAEVGDAS